MVPFIWKFKFELQSEPCWQQWPIVHSTEQVEKHYEMRFFWPESQSICLKGFSKNELWLSPYQMEVHQDSYLMLADERNIKFRKKKLHYKPLLQEEGNVICYANKQKYHLLKQQSEIIKLLTAVPPATDLKQLKQVKQWLYSQYTICDVHKETLSLVLIPENQLTLEFSRIACCGTYYHSLVIESTRQPQVEQMAQALGVEQEPKTYINFLKEQSC